MKKAVVFITLFISGFAHAGGAEASDIILKSNFTAEDIPALKESCKQEMDIQIGKFVGVQKARL